MQMYALPLRNIGRTQTVDEQEALINGLQSQLQRTAADVAARDAQLAALNAEAGSLRTRVADLTRVTDQQLLQARLKCLAQS